MHFGQTCSKTLSQFTQSVTVYARIRFARSHGKVPWITKLFKLAEVWFNFKNRRFDERSVIWGIVVLLMAI